MNTTGSRNLGIVSPLGLLTTLLLAASPASVFASSANASCTGCPARVPDGGAAAQVPQLLVSAATLPAASCDGAAPAGGVEVRLDLLHNHVGDLRLRLIGPDNSAYTLIDRLPDGALSCAGEDVLGSFVGGVEGATAPSCGVRIPAVGGLVLPASSLDALAAAPVAGGSYTLEIGDHADAGEGLLRSWQFNVYCEQFGVLFRDGFDD